MKKIFSFSAKGHTNISARHKNTFEFTKEGFVTPSGDCIIGVKSDFGPFDKARKIVIEISVNGIKEIVHAEFNSGFSSKTELVIRKSDFLSDRTFAINADKACADFSDKFRESLSNPESNISVVIKNEEKTIKKG